MYLVLELCDRQVSQVLHAETRGDASELANQLLREHCKLLDQEDLYEKYASGSPPDIWPPEMHLDDPADAEAGAWCNLNQLDFDAHIMYLPDVTAMNMLYTLLKQLCKSRMDKSCRDGCDDCPITAVLATAKLAAEQAQADLDEKIKSAQADHEKTEAHNETNSGSQSTETLY